MNLVIEHLKETNTSWHNSHSFGMNFGAMVNFGMNPCASNCLLSVPGARNHKESSRKETLVESGIYAQEIYINIGKTIEMTPTLRNEEKTSVFDTSIASSIGSMMSGVHEIEENWEAIREARNQKLYTEVKDHEIKNGAPEFEAETLACEVVEFNEICEETEAKLEAAREELAEKIKAEVAKDPEFQKVAESYIDPDYLSEFVDKYCDNLTNINAYLEEYRAEVSEIQDAAVEKVSSKDWADKLGDYAISFVDVLNESCSQVAADPFGTLGDAAYFVGDTFLPGGLHNFSDAIHGRTSLSDAVKNEAKDISIDVAICFCCAGFLKAGGKLWNPIKTLFKKTQTKAIHKNSMEYRGETHVYVIRDTTNKIEYKIGESAQGLNKYGQSKRAEQQARKLRKETGNAYKTSIITILPGKREARQLETKLIRERRAQNPEALPGNKGEH